MGVPIGGQTGLNRRVNSPIISRIKQILPQSAPRTSIWNKSECKLRFTALLPRASLTLTICVNPVQSGLRGSRSFMRNQNGAWLDGRAKRSINVSEYYIGDCLHAAFVCKHCIT
jgi:hypothetical protein